MIQHRRYRVDLDTPDYDLTVHVIATSVEDAGIKALKKVTWHPTATVKEVFPSSEIVDAELEEEAEKLAKLLRYARSNLW